MYHEYVSYHITGIYLCPCKIVWDTYSGVLPFQYKNFHHKDLMVMRPSISIIRIITYPGPVFCLLLEVKHSLCSANHRAGYFSNLACDWLSSLSLLRARQKTGHGRRFILKQAPGSAALTTNHHKQDGELRETGDQGSPKFGVAPDN